MIIKNTNLSSELKLEGVNKKKIQIFLLIKKWISISGKNLPHAVILIYVS